MRAMILETPGPIETDPLRSTDLTPPKPGPNELLIRIGVCGICHTDLHTTEGELELPKLPIVPGHQIVGFVEATGRGVSRWNIRDRVGVSWLYSSCGRCGFCSSGRENLCENIRFTGLHVNGGYEELMVVHEDYAYSIPDVFQDEHAAPLLCAGIIGYRSLRLAEVPPGGRLGLFGFGASAHIALQIALGRSYEVFVFSRGADHRALATSLGAQWVGEPAKAPPTKLDSAIIFAPAGRLVHTALEYLDRGGTLAINAIHMSPIPEIPYHLIYHERTVRSVANATRRDALEFLEEAAALPVHTRVESFSLSQANEALLRLKEGRINGAAVLRIG